MNRLVRTLAIGLTCSALAFVGSAAGAQGSSSPRGGQVAWTLGESGSGPGHPVTAAKHKPWLAYQWESWVRLIHPDGTGNHVLTTSPGGGQEHPDWSPDGRHLVMDVEFQSLWVVDVDSAGEGTGAREIYRCEAPCAFVQDGAWSPDGREIAFLRYSQSMTDPEIAAPPEVVGLLVDSGRLRTIYRSKRPSDGPFSPRWSPDGKHLVIDETRFASDRLDEGEVVGERVVVVSADGSGVRREITQRSFGSGQVDWGRNGRIVTTRGGNLWTMRPDGTQRHPITNYDDVRTHAIQPTWAPSGNSVVFTYVTGQFGVDDHPTLGLTWGAGMRTTVWSPDRPAISHPRLQPAPQGETVAAE